MPDFRSNRDQQPPITPMLHTRHTERAVHRLQRSTPIAVRTIIVVMV